MKKYLCVLLTLCLIFAYCFTLASCGVVAPYIHDCEFSDEWTNDEHYHWHSCSFKICREVSDKAAHDWDEGVITTVPTQEADGVITFTCMTCGATTTSVAKFTGITKGEWSAAFAISNFKNFKYVETAIVSAKGVTVETENVYKFTEDAVLTSLTAYGETEETYITNKHNINSLRIELIDEINNWAFYNNYEYDYENKLYKAKKEIYLSFINAYTDNITMKFADGKLIEIFYDVTFTRDKVEYHAVSTITFSDYGTVVVYTPEQ